MARLIDLTGKKFGRWTVVTRAENKNNNTIWYCKCECGTEKEVSGDTLKNGVSKSCGCLRSEITSKRSAARKGTSSGKKIDLTGKQFDRLTVIEIAGRDNRGEVLWKCICVCGNEKITTSSRLRTLQTKSCGCIQKEMASNMFTTHGNTKHPDYYIWLGIKLRCENKNDTGYSYYGGRGIKVEWESFEEFIRDMGPRPSLEHSVERREVDGNYCRSNCYWATKTEQMRNTRRTNRSGNGVSSSNGKWRARIWHENREIYLGTYSKKEDAIQARKEAELKYWGKSS